MAKLVVKRKRISPSKRLIQPKPVKKESTVRKYAMHSLRTILLAFAIAYVSASFCIYFDAGFKVWTLTMFTSMILISMFSNYRIMKGRKW